jgi:hypothetical protein
MNTNRAVLTVIDSCVGLYEHEEEAIIQFRVSGKSQLYLQACFF